MPHSLSSLHSSSRDVFVHRRCEEGDRRGQSEVVSGGGQAGSGREKWKRSADPQVFRSGHRAQEGPDLPRPIGTKDWSN